jgi:hypothetical protein
MRRNGFESSRALWVVPVDEDCYEVFAGGTRLAAAREAALTDIPVLVHGGYDDTAISRLADEDNENDEYHVPVPLPDIWKEYHRLNKRERWTQEKIAEVKRVGEGPVSERIGFAQFPPSVLGMFLERDFLLEVHARELLKSSKFEDLPPWLTRAQALIEIMENIFRNHRGASQGIAPATSIFTKEVTAYNAMISEAQKALAHFPAQTEEVAPRARGHPTSPPDLAASSTTPGRRGAAPRRQDRAPRPTPGAAHASARG